jgi:3',5'-cyclic AMP phosphodiesterase CpdA
MLLDRVGGTVFTTGDNVYNGPTLEHYNDCYGPSWGRHRSRTRPSPGNHDQEPPGPATYFDYFGSAAGPFGRGYYSYNVAGWHVISLDSQAAMSQGSPQYQWLEADLASSSARCTVAYWHRPLFSSGPNGSTQSVYELWRLLYAGGADVVMNGHDHAYERFAPQDPDGRADTTRGIRQFTVGTGGAALYGFSAPRINSEVRASVHGVLKLTLSATGYAWEFISVAGQAFSDAGSGTCH